MMSIGAALSAATTLVGTTLPAGLIGAPSGKRAPARQAQDAETAVEAGEVFGPPPEDGALLVAIEESLREAGYLAS
ncbi:hypothetical protein DK419_20555 [Methylobacterium terrae]|uniref:Uncharacterized protein n=1 Tax=Methylobacterium terrae TaxID=2202827 RepID=A0A2U8WSM4_9HYPH|nr:hypothetical protein [Methylobacterium terrae]AWN48451.1 hypothetical protein DK419_20555 [Methylobacterium terrae]